MTNLLNLNGVIIAKKLVEGVRSQLTSKEAEAAIEQAQQMVDALELHLLRIPFIQLESQLPKVVDE